MREVESDLRDWIYREAPLMIKVNEKLAVFGEPAEELDAFEKRCEEAADEKLQEEEDKLEEKYKRKVASLETKLKREERELEADLPMSSAGKKKNTRLMPKRYSASFRDADAASLRRCPKGAGDQRRRRLWMSRSRRSPI